MVGCDDRRDDIGMGAGGVVTGEGPIWRRGKLHAAWQSRAVGRMSDVHGPLVARWGGAELRRPTAMSDMEVTERITAAGPSSPPPSGGSPRRFSNGRNSWPSARSPIWRLGRQGRSGDRGAARRQARFRRVQRAAVVGAGRSLPAAAPAGRADPRARRPPPVERHRAIAMSNLVATIDNRQPSDLDEVVTLLSDLRRAVLVLAGEAEHGVGHAVRPRPRRAARRCRARWPATRSLCAASSRRARPARHCSSSTCAATSAGCSTPWR